MDVIAAFLSIAFPRHSNVVAGLVLGGLALGALPFTLFQKDFLNPDNFPVNR